jgi:hypothetical protein
MICFMSKHSIQLRRTWKRILNLSKIWKIRFYW